MYCVIDFGPEAMYRNIDQWICRLPDITVPTHARVYLPSFVLFLIWRGHLQVMIPCPCPTLLVLPLGVSSSFSFTEGFVESRLWGPEHSSVLPYKSLYNP